MNLFTKQNHILSEFMVITRWGEGIVRVWDGHVHTPVSKMDDQQGPTV